MAENKYWFARRFPVGHPRNAMAPISPEGWLIMGSLVLDLVIGAALWFYLASIDQMVLGIIVFAVLAASGLGLVLYMLGSKGDQQHTVDDYKNARVGNQ